VSGPPLPADDRPVDRTPVDTADLPATPVRDRNIPAGAWRQAPTALLTLGDEFDGGEAMYKRRIGGWLLWRSGPASRARARYLAVHADDLARQFDFRLAADGAGQGAGPSGEVHDRFRAWKQDLLAHP
jgi:hypothetical protein